MPCVETPKSVEIDEFDVCARSLAFALDGSRSVIEEFEESARTSCTASSAISIPPFELWRVGLPYGDWSCEPQPDFPSYGAPYKCYVWVRDGRVIGRCSGCEPD